MKRIGGLCALALLGGLAGCETPLFPKSAERTPYERYQVLRGEAIPSQGPAGTGQDGPSLRDRLQPLGHR